jgi:hypothetical protein
MEQGTDGTANRSKAGTVIGVLHIIFTGFGIIGGFISLGTFSILQKVLTKFGPEFAGEFQMLMGTINAIFSLIIVITLVQFAINAVGLVAGIGLLKRKFWSILLSNIYAIATIVLVVANFFAVRQIVLGILENPVVTGSIPQNELFAIDIMKSIIPGLTGVFGIFTGSAYPVIALVLLNRSKVKDFYAARREER